MNEDKRGRRTLILGNHVPFLARVRTPEFYYFERSRFLARLGSGENSFLLRSESQQGTCGNRSDANTNFEPMRVSHKQHDFQQWTNWVTLPQ
jgi:hypothetical protein